MIYGHESHLPNVNIVIFPVDIVELYEILSFKLLWDGPLSVRATIAKSRLCLSYL